MKINKFNKHYNKLLFTNKISINIVQTFFFKHFLTLKIGLVNGNYTNLGQTFKAKYIISR